MAFNSKHKYKPVFRKQGILSSMITYRVIMLNTLIAFRDF